MPNGKTRKLVLEVEEDLFNRLNELVLYGLKKSLLEKVTIQLVEELERLELEDTLVSTKYLKGHYRLHLEKEEYANG